MLPQFTVRRGGARRLCRLTEFAAGFMPEYAVIVLALWLLIGRTVDAALMACLKFERRHGKCATANGAPQAMVTAIFLA
jgi:hypothetical protein